MGLLVSISFPEFVLDSFVEVHIASGRWQLSATAQAQHKLLFIEFFLPHAVIKKNLDNGDVSSLLIAKSLAVKLNDCSFFFRGSGLLHMAVTLFLNWSKDDAFV